ncbi:MAG: hypothetical protein HeimC2_12930 [Candidatus Heimdallarchaeota archaeon LC_2]|nr:MAG: hypothetical protein HeimC2_12930 [Candidatus Heimdallarchaeota archaeon LC_2]
MLNYPLYLDENSRRPIAKSVFTLSLISIIRPEVSWIIIPLFVDFILRYIHPRLSPLVISIKLINKNIVHKDVVPTFSPPKRFAILIGVVISGIASFGLLFNFTLIYLVSMILLLFASFLQGFFGYCIGCELYDKLIKIGLISQNKRIRKNSSNYIEV